MSDTHSRLSDEIAFKKVVSPGHDGAGTTQWDRLAASAILVLGSPRSGTTWLAKIIDSHPDILYRHEPDECSGDTRWASPAGQIGTWISQRGLRAAAKRPFFAKSWRPEPLETIHKGLALALAAAQRAPLSASLAGRLALPDLAAGPGRDRMRAAIKLVNWDGSAAVATMPGTRCCFILRHPCGQVASVLQGLAAGRFAPQAESRTDLAAAASHAASKGTGPAAFQALTTAGKLAWKWLAFNEPAVEALRTQPNARIVVYEDLCRHPLAAAKGLFAFAGLDWHRQTQDFLADSTRADRSNGYFDVFRVSAATPDRWRRSMTRQDQEAIRSVVRSSPLARYWPDLA